MNQRYGTSIAIPGSGYCCSSRISVVYGFLQACAGGAELLTGEPGSSRSWQGVLISSFPRVQICVTVCVFALHTSHMKPSKLVVACPDTFSSNLSPDPFGHGGVQSGVPDFCLIPRDEDDNRFAHSLKRTLQRR
jgi:hypothetical protein